MSSKDELLGMIRDFEIRITRLEQKAARAEHVHAWQYSKTAIGSDDSFAGRSLLWRWDCPGDQSNSTGDWSHVPDHFPRDLR